LYQCDISTIPFNFLCIFSFHLQDYALVITSVERTRLSNFFTALTCSYTSIYYFLCFISILIQISILLFFYKVFTKFYSCMIPYILIIKNYMNWTQIGNHCISITNGPLRKIIVCEELFLLHILLSHFYSCIFVVLCLIQQRL